MELFGKTRKTLLLLLILISVLTFFLPLISVSLPIVGRLEWSALNIVSQMTSTEPAREGKPSFSNLAKNIPNMSAEDQGPQSKSEIPFGFKLARFIPLEIALTYILLLAIVGCLLVPSAQKVLGLIAIVGTASSGAALVSTFVFSNAIQQMFSAEMNKPEMRDNPFAAIGQAFANSVRVDAGVALYLLSAVMIGVLLVWQFSWLDRLALTSEAAQPTNL